MSWFKSSDQSVAAADGPNFFPITSHNSGFGELTAKDTEWACTSNKGFQSETQVWYTVLGDGSLLLVQIIWSYIGVFLIPATTQMTFKLYNPHTKKTVWRSISATGAKPNGRGYKAHEFEVKHTGSPSGEEAYAITASLDKSVQISVTFTKPADAPGFKFGTGEEGGYSNFGKQDPSKRDGFVVHRFHPLAISSGTVVIDGAIVDAKGDGMFVHAIQGMRPNIVASRWNFGFFTSGGENKDGKLGSVRAVQMEFETTDEHGPKGPKSGRTKVNIGAVYCTALPPSPLLVTGQTHTPAGSAQFPVISKDISSAKHISPIKDKDTGYMAPGGIEFEWEGERRDGKGRANAKVLIEKQGAVVGEGGLMEKVDVLQEIPYVIRKGLAAVTGTKPFIFQYHNPATLEITLDDEVIPVKGWLFNEASYVSD